MRHLALGGLCFAGCLPLPASGPCDGQVLTGSTGEEWFGLVVAVGDFDADGLADLAIGVRSAGDMDRGETRIYRGDGVGFDPVPWAVLPGPPSSLTARGDLTGDGVDDLVVMQETDDETDHEFVLIEVWAGGETPTLSWSWSALDGEDANPGLAVADLDGDGRRDLALMLGYYASAEMGVFPGGPAGLPAVPATRVSLPRDERYVEQDVGGLGDLDGDDVEELVFGRRLLWGGATIAEVPDHPGSRGQLATGDLDGDGVEDLVVAAWTDDGGAVSWLRGGSAALAPDVVLRGPAGGQLVEGAVLGDITGDGVAELLVGDRMNRRIALHPGSPAGPEPVALLEATGAQDWFGEALVPTPDLDGGGLPDFVVPVANSDAGSVVVCSCEAWH